jgi:DNA-binding transcriptional MocR family regulator
MPLPRLTIEDEGTPVYRQIADGIRAAILGGELAEGARLPAIRALAVELTVNRDTVALAYDALVGEGLIESAVGRGTFVRSSPASPDDDLLSLDLTVQVEHLLNIEDSRTRFGGGDDVIAMHALVPDPAWFPIDDFRRALNRAVARHGPELFVYGSAQGHPSLRAVLAERFGAVGMDVTPSDIVLCHGASQGISLALRLFASTGDSVAVEGPTYHNVLATLAGLGMQPAVVPMTEAGPDLAALERVLSRPDVKAFYTIPTFHNPMGISTDISHRRALLQVARRCGKPIVEDAFEMDLRCTGRPTPPLAALDRHGVVVHLHSFSKSLFPGLRIGSIAARGRVLDGLVALKHATDLSDSMLLQAALAQFIEEGAYERHLRRIRRELRRRHKVLAEALEAHMPETTRWTRPEGGYQVWVELPFPVDTRDLLADAARAGVLFSPGSQFMPDGGTSRALRLTIARANEDEIRSGVATLGSLACERKADAHEPRQSAGLHL